jgi:hypothetical protein
MGSLNGGKYPIGKDYMFEIWAYDGDPEKLRIKIYDEDEIGGEMVVYDNDVYDPETELGGGSIKICN